MLPEFVPNYFVLVGGYHLPFALHIILLMVLKIHGSILSEAPAALLSPFSFLFIPLASSHLIVQLTLPGYRTKPLGKLLEVYQSDFVVLLISTVINRLGVIMLKVFANCKMFFFPAFET